MRHLLSQLPSMSIAEISGQIALDVIPKDYFIRNETLRKEVARSFVCRSPTALPKIIPNLKLVVKRIQSQVVHTLRLVATMIEFHQRRRKTCTTMLYLPVLKIVSTTIQQLRMSHS